MSFAIPAPLYPVKYFTTTQKSIDVHKFPSCIVNHPFIFVRGILNKNQPF